MTLFRDDPAFADVAGGLLFLTHDSNSFNYQCQSHLPPFPTPFFLGGEIGTQQVYGYGRFRARLRAPQADGVVFGFYTYFDSDTNNDNAGINEIDVEIVTHLNAVVFGTYADSGSFPPTTVHSPTSQIGNIDIRQFHEYGFDWHSDRVIFLIDGQPVFTVTNPSVFDLNPFNDAPIPSVPGTVRLTLWAPDSSNPLWHGSPPASDVHAFCDYASFAPWPSSFDSTPPVVISTSHTTAVGTNIAINFSEAMDPSSFSEERIVVVGSQSGWHSASVSYLPSLESIIIDPDTDFSDDELVTVALLSDMMDLSGNQLGASYGGNAYVVSFYTDPALQLPPNDTCANATTIGDGTFTGTNGAATTDGSAMCGLGSDHGTRDVWWKYVAPHNGLATITTCGSTFDTILSVQNACYGPELACDDDGCGQQSSVAIYISQGTNYFVRVAGKNGATGVITLHTSSTPTPTSIAVTGALTPSTNVEPGSAVLVAGTVSFNTGAAVPVGTVFIDTGQDVYTAPINNGSFSRTIAAPNASGNVGITATDSVYGLVGTISMPITIQGYQGGDGYTFNRSTQCRSVQATSPYDPIYETNWFRRSDAQAMTWVELTNVTRSVNVRWRWYTPSGQYLTSQYTIPDPHGYGYDYWTYYRTWAWIYNFQYEPGRYRCDVDVDSGSGWRYRATQQFWIGWEFTEHRMCQNVQSSSPFQPIGETNVFHQTDQRAVTWANANDVSESFDVKWEFHEPNGSLYNTFTLTTDDPGQNQYYGWYRFWGWIDIAGANAAGKCGNWQVRVFIRDVGGNWVPTYTDYFQLLESPNVPPVLAVSASPSSPDAGQNVDLTATASDNTYLSRIDIRWRLNGADQPVQSWTDLNLSQASRDVVIGPFSCGDSIEYWATAADTSGNVRETGHTTIVVGNTLPPENPTATPPIVCSGQSSTLSATVGAGETVDWFANSCAGVVVPGGASPVVSPTSTTTYFARARRSGSNCVSGSCTSVTVNIMTSSISPSGASATPTVVCPGNPSTLTVQGGQLGSGASWKWYSGACGGIFEGTGPSIQVWPASGTTYYVHAENGCNTTACTNVTVVVGGIPSTPTSPVAAPSAICSGQSSMLSATVDAGETVDWFTGSCGGAAVPGGANATVSPVETTTFFARARNTASGCTSPICAQVTLLVSNPNSGDINGDGLLDVSDITPFVAILLNQATAASYALCAADMDQSGTVDGLDVQPFVNALLAPCISPTISQQPQDAVASAGSPVTFTVAANGNEPLAYQWRKGGADLTDDGRISGSTTTALSISSVQSGDAGTYDVVVTNSCGSLTSNEATLAIQTAAIWTLRTSQGPSPRSGSSMVFDSSRGVGLLFGGSAGSMNYGDTWTWNGTSWTQLSPGLSPSARNQHAMAFDGSSRQEVVLFGGSDTAPESDTWTWNGVNWTLKNPANHPSARTGHTMAFDSSRNVVVLFGGNAGATYSAETWEWNGTDWTLRMPATSPPGRAQHAMVYDVTRGVTVLFGGYDGALLNDMWTWNGTNWTQVTTSTRPSPRFGHTLVYDPGRSVAVLFGGELGNFNTPNNDTWEWNGSIWAHPIPTISPTARVGHAMAYDGQQASPVIFGGTYDVVNTYLGDTWQYQFAGSSSNHVFVANENAPNSVREMDPATNTFVRAYNVAAWTSNGAGRYLAFDTLGRLWVTNDNPSHVYAIGENGVVMEDYDIGSQIRDIEFSRANGMLYLVINSGFQVIELDPETGSQTTRIDTGFEADYLGFAPDGNLYVTRYAGGGGSVYNPSTFSLIQAFAAPPSATGTAGIAFVGSNFYLTSWSGSASFIDEFRLSDGAYVRRVASFPYGLASIKRASEMSLWAVGAFSGYGAVAEVSLATGEVLRVLPQGGFSASGNQDIELGQLGTAASFASR